MKRAVIYARYSSDIQNPTSVEDQVRILKERAVKDGYEIVTAYEDHAINGHSIHMRPGIQGLLHASAKGQFEYVWAEALDRISRDQADIANLYRHLTFYGVKIVTIAEGEINEMHIGLKGTMNAMFTKDMAKKVHRGQRGRVEKGFTAGSIAYGYDVVKTVLDANGDSVKGVRAINLQEAAIIVRIFEDYAAGKSPRTIAKALNQEGVPSPRGGEWNPSAIYGNRKRGLGILNNEGYIGVIAWNKNRNVFDPTTRRRLTRSNDASDIIRTSAPELRIVEQDLWDKVKKIQGGIKSNTAPYYDQRRVKTLFTGLIKCGCCGGGFHRHGRDSYVCFSAKDKGTCDNHARIKIPALETVILKELEQNLLNPELCQKFCDAFINYLKRKRIADISQRSALESELKKRKRDEQRLLDLAMEGFGDMNALKERVTQNQKRMDEINASLIDQPETPPLLHPSMGTHYRRQIGRLIERYNEPDSKLEVSQILRSLVEKIVINRVKGSNDVSVDFYGDLAGILSMATGKEKSSEVVLNIAGQINMATALDNAYHSETVALPRAYTLTTFHDEEDGAVEQD